MARTIVDLIGPAGERRGGRSARPPAEIEYFDHRQTAAEVVGFFPGLREQDLPDGEGWAIERIDISTHNGTHLDAPWHFASTMDGGKRAITIDEVPLDWCFQPGVKLDFRHFPDGYVATAADVEAELKRIGHELEAARHRRRQHLAPACATASPTMCRPAAAWAARRRSISPRAACASPAPTPGRWDAPFVHTAKKYAETKQRQADLGGPQGRPRDRLLPHREAAQPGGAAGARLHGRCFPVKIRAASAGWTRAVAILED